MIQLAKNVRVNDLGSTTRDNDLNVRVLANRYAPGNVTLRQELGPKDTMIAMRTHSGTYIVTSMMSQISTEMTVNQMIQLRNEIDKVLAK